MHKLVSLIAGIAVVATLALSGCTPEKSGTDKSATTDPEAKIKGFLEKLDPEDRKLAEAQKWCAAEPERRLGEMGKP
jgi:hypothetical protein